MEKARPKAGLFCDACSKYAVIRGNDKGDKNCHIRTLNDTK